MPRIRPEGGVIGLNNTPTQITAPGIWTMPDVVRNLRNSTWPLNASDADPYFNLNSLLIHADSTDGKTNVSYVDSSINGYTATASGRPYQGSFSPFSQTGWSNFFNGTTDFLTVPSNAAFATGTGDFTVEAWIFHNGAAPGGGVTNDRFIFGGFTTSPAQVFFLTNSSLAPALWDGTTQYTATTGITPNSWNHVAWVRASNTLTFYINGVAVGPTSSSITTNFTATRTSYIGRNDSTTDRYFPGYISNLRVVKGTAVYTSAFTPSRIPLTAVFGTSLLTAQDNAFKDDSSNAFAITPNGTPSIQSFSPFAPTVSYSTDTIGGSAYFNGSTDYITLPNNMTALGNGAYTLEGWFYPTTTSAGEIPLIKLFNATQAIEFRIVSNKIQGRINNGATIVGGNTTLYPNQWYHFALVKPTAGTSTAVLYINGVAESTTASDNTTYTAFTTPRVGANQTPSIYYTGWISGVRLIRGAAQYTGNFALPTAPPTNTGSTLFLLNFTNSGIIDQTAKINLSTFGSAAVSTTQNKFGGSSISCITGTSYLLASASNTLEFGSGNFTIEFWWYPVSTSRQALYHGSFGTDWSIGIDYSAVSTNQKIGIWASSSGSSWNLINADNGGNGIGTTTVTQNAWNHIAYVRNGTTWMLFVNGNRDLNVTGVSGSIVSRPTTLKAIGAWYSTGSVVPQTGYIDDFRISKVARYSTNFTPATTAFVNQ